MIAAAIQAALQPFQNQLEPLQAKVELLAKKVEDPSAEKRKAQGATGQSPSKKDARTDEEDLPLL